MKHSFSIYTADFFLFLYIKMKTKLSLLLFIYLLLAIIDNVSNQTFKYKQFSIPECENNLEYSSLNLEILKFPKEFVGAILRLDFEETESKTPYVFDCRLDDDKIQKLLSSSKTSQDVTLSCFYLNDQFFNDTISVELNLQSSSILGGNSVDLVKEGGNGENKILFQLKTCDPNPLQDFQYMFNRKIYLRQTSHYVYSPEEQKMTFLLSAFASQNLPANYTTQISVLYLESGEKKDGFCISKQEIKASDDNISPVNFNCQIDNYIEEEELGMFVLGTSFIQMSSTIDSASNPEQGDYLISTGEIKDLSVEKMPPIFTPETISFDYSDGNVTLYIKGKFNEDIEGQHYFPMAAVTAQYLSCFIENVSKDVEVEIKCDVLGYEGTNIEDIIILGIDVFDMDVYGNELFFFKPFSTIQFPEIIDINKFLTDISFRQVCNFETNLDLKEIIFTFVAIISEPIKKGEKLNMTVNLIKGKESEDIEEEVTCISQEDVNPEDGKQLQAEFDCKLESIEKANEYTGLEIVRSNNISGIPTDTKLINPVEVDKLIKKGEVKNYTSEEFKNEEIPVFNATSIDTSNSEETGKFIINGELLSEYTLQVSFEFEIFLITGEKAICTIPKIKENEKEIKIECILQEELKDTKIMIEQCAAFDGYNEIFRMNKISTEEEVTIGNGKEIEEERMYDINLSFGQVNSFEVEENIIEFIFIGFVTEELKKDENITMIVNLIKGKELVEEEVTCISQEDVIPENGKQFPVEFECKLENIEKAEEYTGLEIVESDEVSGIPTDPKLLNPGEVDKLIEKGKIKNYTSEEFKKEEIPVFNATSIDTSNSEETGKFIINGELLSEYTLQISFEFEIFLITGEKALCTIPKIKENEIEIKIECVLQEELIGKKIMIEQCAALDGYNEIFRINKISTEEEVTIGNGKEIEEERMFDINLSFGQVNSFEIEENIIEFIFIGFVTEELKKDENITMIINLVKGKELVEEEVTCVSQEDVKPENGKQLPVEFDCKLENIEKAEEYTGLEIVESEEISGIPTDPKLLNPVEVDKLIEKGEIKNYTSEEFKKEEIPVFNATSIDTSNSEETGIFIINGELLSEYTLQVSIEFEIFLITGEKAICTIPKIKEKESEIKIECVLQEKLIGKKIMIEQCAALDGYNEIFRMNKISTEEEVTIGNGKEIEEKKMFNIDLSFGQVSGFEKGDNKIEFVFVGFTSEELKKDEDINLQVNLVKGEELIEEEANCLSKTDVTPINGKQLSAQFECKVENIKDTKDITGLEIVDSEDVNGIPSDPVLINPAKVDELIEVGEIIDYSKEENKDKIESVPVFNATSIDTSECLKSGKFLINGELLSKLDVDEEFKFEIKLVSGQTAKCTLPVVNGQGKIEIECLLQEELIDSKIMIEQCGALDGYTELFRMNKISTEEVVTVSNGKEKELESKFDVNLSFRQTNKFKFDSTDKSVTFTIAAFSNEPVKKGEEINVDVNLLIGIDSQKEEAKCKVENDKASSGEQVPVTLGCEVSNLELKEGDECTGLEIVESEGLSNIPEDPVLSNPKKTDKLIALGEIEEANEEFSIPEFNATEIDTKDSISTGTFTIKGKPLDEIKKEFIFDITLLSGEKATCTLPKSNKGSNAEIKCTLDGTIDDSKIMIGQTTVLINQKESFILDKVSTETKVSCSNGKLKKMNKKMDNKLSFRQMSHFKPSGNEVSYAFSAFAADNMPKGKKIGMNVNLEKKSHEFLSKTATCILSEEIKGASETFQIPADFDCSVADVPNAEEFIGLELSSCEEINGVPEDLNMTNPATIDALVKIGEIPDFTLEENKAKIPPTFKPSSFGSLGCKSSGIFSIRGKFNKVIDKHFKFNLPLSYPSIESRCTVPEAKEGAEVEIECKTKSPFSSSKIIIEQSTIRKDNLEIMSLLSSSSEEEISCGDYFASSKKKMRKKFKSPFSYRQTQKFKNDNGDVSFSLFAFKTENYKNEKNIEIKANLLKNSALRHLEEIIPTFIDCSASSTNRDPLELECNTKTDSDVNGVVIIDSDDMMGIPSNKTLCNPALSDSLIQEGKMKDCSAESCSLPIFSKTKFSNSVCKDGTIDITGDIDGAIPDGSIFNLSIYPDSFGDCNITLNSKKIECFNKEEIDSQPVMIEEATVSNLNGSNLFLLKGGVKSDDDDISCAINENYHRLSNSQGQDLTPIKNESDPSSKTTTPTSESESGSESKSESGSKSGSESKSGTESESKSGSESESKSGAESESKSGSESGSKSGSESESESGAESGAESGTESGTGSEAESGSKPQPSANETIHKYLTHRQSKSKSGLSGGAIVAIVLSIVVALIAIIALIGLFKSKNFGLNKKTVVTIENSTNFENSAYKLKTPVKF